MNAKEKLHARIDELSDAEAETARIVVAESEPAEAPEKVDVPEQLRRFESGRPQPDWTAAVREDREHGH